METALGQMLEQEDEAQSFDPIQLLLLPILILCQCFAHFAEELTRLRKMRRQQLPTDWQDHFERLKLAEWYTRSATGAGVDRLLKGEDFAISELAFVLDYPDDLQIPMPASALAMHR